MANSGFNLLPQGVQIDKTGLQQGLGQSTLSGGMQADAAQMARDQALGKGASPADLQMRAGLLQAQQAAGSTAASTRGNFGLAGAQRMAQEQQAGMAQNAVNQAAQMRAQEQQAAMGQYLAAASQKRASDLQAAGLSSQEAIAQANLEQQQQIANQQFTGQLISAGIGAASSLGSAGMSLAKPAAPTYVAAPPQPAAPAAPTSMYSDERLKNEQAGGRNAAEAFLTHLEPHAFSWKGAPSAGPQLGVYAQDVEKGGPMGQAVVGHDPASGAKTLDMPTLLGAMAAGLGHLHAGHSENSARLDALERAVGVRRGG